MHVLVSKSYIQKINKRIEKQIHVICLNLSQNT